MRLEFAASLDAVLATLEREAADALFINQAQFGQDAFRIISRLREMNRDAPVIMMLQQTSDTAVVRALRGGAADCVSANPDAFENYPAVVKRVINRFAADHESIERSRAILNSQKRWMSIIDAITDYIFVLDEAGILVKVNSAFASAIGKHPRDIIGSKIRDVFERDIPNTETHTSVLDSGIPSIYEERIGDDLFQVSVFPYQEENRLLAVHVMKNITEVKRLKDQLYYADKLASIGQLVSGVAHEINNPLTGTIAYTELLIMKVTDNATRDTLKKILNSAERCKKIIENLLTFSRQRSPSKSLESVNDIIDRAIDLRSYWLRSNNIEIVREYDPVSTVFVDAQQIQQVILNLLLNAEQALVAASAKAAKIRLVTQSDKVNRRVVISVIDNGPGISQKIASKIFDPFFTTKPVGIGTGLGLSISHGIITEHGGTIRFETAEGGGAAFIIELPTGTGALPGAAG